MVQPEKLGAKLIVLDEIFNISVPTSTIARKIQGNGLMGYWTSAKFFFSDILKTSSDKVLGKYEEQDHGLKKQYLHHLYCITNHLDM